MRGSCTSVQASASFCFMPPDSASARRERNRRQLRQLEQPLAPLADGRIAHAKAVNLGEERDVFVDGQIAIQTEALREIAQIAASR